MVWSHSFDSSRSEEDQKHFIIGRVPSFSNEITPLDTRCTDDITAADAARRLRQRSPERFQGSPPKRSELSGLSESIKAARRLSAALEGLCGKFFPGKEMMLHNFAVKETSGTRKENLRTVELSAC